MIRALIFDVDGTLSETEEVHRKAFNETFAAVGLSWRWDMPLYSELLKVTGGKERIRAYITRVWPTIEMTDEEISALHSAKTRVYGEMIARGGVELRPGLRTLVEQAKARRIKIAVATTTNLPNVDALCMACWGELASKVFDVIAAGDEAPLKKPAPDIYNIALQRLNLAPQQCVVFEDSRNGLMSAKAAGLRVVVTPSRYTMGECFAEADLLLRDLGEFDITRFDAAVNEP